MKRFCVWVSIVLFSGFGLAFGADAEPRPVAAPAATGSGAGSSDSGNVKAAPKWDGTRQEIPSEGVEGDPLGSDLDEKTIEELRRNPPLRITPGLMATEDPASGPVGPLPGAPSTTSSLQGVAYTGWYPPDNGMAAGPSHLLEAVNAHWRAWTRAGVAATNLIPFCGTGGWWTPVLPAGITYCFDPKLVYDQHSGRWVLLAVAWDPPTQRSWYLLSTSFTSDPTGSWCLWSLNAALDGSTSTTNWADYPGLGVDSQAVYITSNQFSSAGYFQYTKLRIVGKSQLYNNTCGSVSWWDFWNLQHAAGGTAFTVHPAHTFGTPGAEYLVSSGSGSGSGITQFTLTNPLGAPPTLTSANVATQSYSYPPTAEQCLNATPINTGDTRLLNAVYRSGRLYTAHSSACPSDTSKSCVHLLEINPTTAAATFDQFYGAWSTGWYYYYPAIMPDQSGNVHLIFNRSKSNADTSAGCVELRQSGKLAAELTIEASAGLKTGVSSYVSVDSYSRNRWGDYSGIAPDPADADAVWMSGEYVSSTNIWSTWIGQTRFTGSPVCYTLSRSHTGPGSDPAASPGSSAGCAAGQYQASEVISLTAAPSGGASVVGWTGTDNDASTAVTNTLTMPAGNTSVSVAYLADVALSNGVSYPDSMTAPSNQGTWRYYYFDLAAGSTNLVADLFGMSADVDLYVRRNAKPTLASWDCRPYVGGTTSEQCVFASPASGRWWIGVVNFATGTMSFTVRASWTKPAPAGLDLYTVTPCRLVDTRLSTPLTSQVTRTFAIPGTCGIPASAKVLALNVTVVGSTAGGNVSLWPADLGKPVTSVVNFSTSETRANNAIALLATDGTGGLSSQAYVVGGGTVHLLLDVVGYFQ